MKAWLVRGLALALLIALGVWIWRVFFPSPERVIRQRLNELAQVASFSENEGALAKLGNPQKLGSYFADEVAIALDIPGRSVQRISGRDELVRGAMAARSSLMSLKVQFIDINVTLTADQQSATAALTLKANVSGERDPIVQELKFSLKKIQGNWLIDRLETVKTLS